MALDWARRLRDIEDIKKRIGVAIGLALLLSACAVPANPWFLADLHPGLKGTDLERVPINASVTVDFGRTVDPTLIDLRINPPAQISRLWKGTTLELLPGQPWAPATTYTLRVAAFQDHRNQVQLKGWQAAFVTQPPLIASLSLNGQPLTGQPLVAAVASNLVISFPIGVQPARTVISANGTPIRAAGVQWSADGRAATVLLTSFPPGQPLTISVDKATSIRGDLLTQASSVHLTPAVLEPTNRASGITAIGTARPVEIVVENSGAARPQVGLQAADMVVEYISEYSISRMTAIYFNAVPPLVGPVRSCRMINIPLNFAFGALTMCSGASDGTLGQLWHQGVRVVINDYDKRGHFFRSSARLAPHNLYTSGDRAARLRTEMSGIPSALLVDPAHDDAVIGQPSPPPAVPLHGVSYSYDASRQLYLRTDHGRPFVDAATGAQLAVKTVAIVHAPFRDAGWVEDINGGAHSIIYDLSGEGPAEVYSDGHMVSAIWHIANGVPLYFTDTQGNVIRLNTGLTWIHVVGNGQVR